MSVLLTSGLKFEELSLIWRQRRLIGAPWGLRGRCDHRSRKLHPPEVDCGFGGRLRAEFKKDCRLGGKTVLWTAIKKDCRLGGQTSQEKRLPFSKEKPHRMKKDCHLVV